MYLDVFFMLFYTYFMLFMLFLHIYAFFTHILCHFYTFYTFLCHFYTFFTLFLTYFHSFPPSLSLPFQLYDGLMTAKDTRLSRLLETISHIRHIKMFTWENSLLNRINFHRLIEMDILKKRKMLDAICVFFGQWRQ